MPGFDICGSGEGIGEGGENEGGGEEEGGERIHGRFVFL